MFRKNLAEPRFSAEFFPIVFHLFLEQIPTRICDFRVLFLSSKLRIARSPKTQDLTTVTQKTHFFYNFLRLWWTGVWVTPIFVRPSDFDTTLFRCTSKRNTPPMEPPLERCWATDAFQILGYFGHATYRWSHRLRQQTQIIVMQVRPSKKTQSTYGATDGEVLDDRGYQIFGYLKKAAYR